MSKKLYNLNELTLLVEMEEWGEIKWQKNEWAKRAIATITNTEKWVLKGK